jgi:hypothetical protein
MADLEVVDGGDMYNWQLMLPEGQTAFGQAKKPTIAQPKITTKMETFFHTHKELKPRTRVCSNCEHFTENFCSLNNWKAEGKDGCGRFSRLPEEESVKTKKVV